MNRLLPPVVVGLFFAVIAVRCALDPYRAEAREQITGLVQGGNVEAATRLLEDYAQRYDEPEDAWYACGTWFRLHQPIRAIDAIWKHPTLPGEKATTRRFAETALLALGWSDTERRERTGLEPYVLIALVEGGNEWAAGRLAEHASGVDLGATTAYFFTCYRAANRRPMDVIVEAFRKRGDKQFDVAAAMGSLHAVDYPEKERDIGILEKVLSSREWRQQYPDVWMVSALSLGRSEHPRAVEALEQEETALEPSKSPRDQENLKYVRNGLLAAGRFRVDEHLAPRVLAARPELGLTTWYLEALIHRYRVGDERSELRLRQVWEGPGARFFDVRERIARAFLLQDVPPSEEAQKTWVGRMIRELQGPKAPLLSHVLARAWMFRSGAPGARDSLIEALRRAGLEFGAGDKGVGELGRPFVEALRALYLYG